MKKIRIIRTTVIEYEPNPSHYDEGSTIDDMLAIDLDVCDEDPELMFNLNVVSDTFKGEIFEGEDE